ncbi:DUF1566 domain-containing protein [Legionella hackeliae]|uniref:NHL repeat protein n=1 Tax=Legionella hackeliae TaxID=449 RepID=A0A0A8UPP6_LEGHA|nr:DUF1566 domain-containing protein [Legionella hackeliae]KTD11459.1 NHL repeat protein [Legionella hackeliae]CEK10708.1 conserved exported protein of unknown function [Legionella hackeliae]STX47457.1 NHL repeat protein [Legionella hackeliae]
MTISRRLFAAFAALFIFTTAEAGKPLWTFDPETATSITLLESDVATVQYTVTNQSRLSHVLQMKPITGVQQVATGNYCRKNFRLAYHQSCTLTLRIIGSALRGSLVGGPTVCDNQNPNECYQPSSEDILKVRLVLEPGQTRLSSSVSTLALRVSGTTRVITITNTGSEVATDVAYSLSSALPAGTTITPANCGTIQPGGSCVLRITPGVSPTATPGNLNPTPITLTIKGKNTNTLAPTLNILTYGSVYQSGFVFAFDDGTPITGSVGGKVAALSNQASPMTGVLWSSDNNGVVVTNNVPGIYQNSTNPPSACNGNTDGSCNTGVIVTYYSPPQTNPAINRSLYAAGRCKATIGGYTDWYLPSICELGYYTGTGPDTGCGTALSPTLQNLQSNLVENGVGNLFGVFWSSTELSTSPFDAAWAQILVLGAGEQGPDDKSELRGVRCVRVLTL